MLLPIHIFPRSLVPLLPLWCAALAILLSEAGLLIGEGRPNLRNVGLAIIVAVGIGSAQLRESANAGYAARHTDSDMAQDIYDQYYHHGFRPDLAAQWLVGQLRHGPTRIVTDFDGYFSLNVIVGRLLNTAPMVVAYYRDQKLKTPSELIRQGVRVFLVAHTLEAANRMTAWFHQPPLSHRDRVAETGFFSIYRLPLAASPPP
jgi:hypothetical protein